MKLVLLTTTLTIVIGVPAWGQDLIVAYDFEGEVGNLFAEDKAGYVDDMGMPVDLPAILDPSAAIVNDPERGDVLQTSSSGFGAQTLYDSKLELETSFTLSAWLKISGSPTAFTHLAGRPGSGPRLFNHWGLGGLGAAQRDEPWTGGFSPVDFGPGGGPDGNWHHLLISWNHVTQEMWGFWDGVNGNTDEAALMGHGILGNSPRFDDSTRLITHEGPPGLIFAIGGNPLTGGELLRDALVDDVAFWDGFADRDVAAGLFDGTYSIFDAPIVDPGGMVSCDFDMSGGCDGSDIDLLSAAIAAGTNDPAFDLTGDGNVDLADRDAWLDDAGNMNIGAPYLVADFDLSGTVDGQDFVIWNGSKFTTNTAWTAGNANGDNNVDGQDFIEWNGNKFTSSDAASVVPEPVQGAWLAWAFIWMAGSLIRRR